jgi:uncharacterized protein (TIGR03437 family)
MSTLRVAIIFLATIWPMAAQVWDNTGNTLLNGKTYYFREVTLTSSDSVAVYGTISFSGGTYSINATALDASQESEGPYTTTGSYSIAASGFGFIDNQLIGSPIYGLVGANGVFVGSVTEAGVSDIFVAAPLTNQSAGTLQGDYTVAYTDATGALTGTPFGAQLQLSANGGGAIGNVNVSAYTTSNSASTQSISGVNYFASGGAFVLTFPTNNTGLVQGQEYVYSTPDGSFIFGGSPEGFDMLVGVRNGSGRTFGGLYYTAGMQIDESSFTSTGEIGLNTYYGSFNAQNGVILGHQRVQNGGGSAYGFTFSDSYPTGSGGSYTDDDLSEQFFGGSDGTQVGVGIGPLPGISVSVQAPSLSASGIYLSPQGIVNAASYAPFTAGVSRGDLIILEGINLGPIAIQHAPSVPFPTTLANVQVLINNIAAPICYVSSTQIAVVVPNEIPEAAGSVAQFQVVYKGQGSNVVTEFMNLTTPGVFTQEENGSGYAAALHPNGSLVTPDNPANIGETIAVFIAGLGDVFPTIADGAAPPSSPLSKTSNSITADISGIAANVSYAGLAPGFVGLYQVNLDIPSGVSSGDNFIGITGPDSYNSEAAISLSGTAAIAAPHAHAQARPHSHMRKVPVVKRAASVPTE